MSVMEYSNYQLAIFNEIEKGESNLTINAVAGSGKTTTIVEACRRLRAGKNNVLFLAFNKNIAEELKSRLFNVAEVATLHSFGLSVIRKVYGNKVKVDAFKYRKYLKENLEYITKSVSYQISATDANVYVSTTLKIFDLCRSNMISATDTEGINEVIDSHNISVNFDEVKAVSHLLSVCYKMPADMTIDFGDMITFPVMIDRIKRMIPTFRFVFIDECQDLNNAQRNLMLCAARLGRFVAVGDRNQAINGFAGANNNSFDLIASLPGTKELPLSVNYRCGSSIIDLAQQIVPQIKSCPGAIAGEIVHTNTLSKSMFKPSDMVLCRKSAPLVGLCIKLIVSGITAVVKGKDIAEELIKLINNYKGKDKSIAALLDYLEEVKEKTALTISKERNITTDKAKETTRYFNLSDKVECIKCIATFNCKNVEDCKNHINTLFSDERMKNAVTLSTVHKAKGLEADRVHILLPDKLPLIWKEQKDWQFQQEINLRYVAITRAKRFLNFVDIEEKNLASQELRD